MPKIKEQPKPLYHLKDDYDASLKNAIHQATMLATCVQALVDYGAIQERAQKQVKERLAAFNKAMY